MAKSKDYAVTMEQGQVVLGLATAFRMPEKLGTKTYTAIERASAERDVLCLYDAIKRVSPMLRKSGKQQGNMFGPEDAWDMKLDADGFPISGDIKDVTREVTLQLSEKAVSGAMWLLLFASHPDSQMPHAGAKLMSDVLFPLAFRLRRLMALEDELGLRNATSKAWAEDEEEVQALPEPKNAPAAV